MSQFDFKAGTNGDAFCIPSGNDKLANPTTNSAKGVTTAPIKGNPVLVSKIVEIIVKPHVKNNNDSYKLLSGK